MMCIREAIKMIRDIEKTKKMLNLLSDRDFLLVSAMIETMLDPDWIMQSEDDKLAYKESIVDIKNNDTVSHEEVLKMFG